ncbi:Fe-S cluster assembly protein SufD [Photobacterium damselae]|uniref:Fe-S cluster assembly protein SufD n=1 Tax=Photobacterium damselae TaxID=38293 RepID=UPI001EFCD997|nr:Fe-S cluster assembly protein SufD [Photobacterium damselae]MCG9777524.1 Fe-S cluster assembly protein SufD [Photobacterium damselae]
MAGSLENKSASTLLNWQALVPDALDQQKHWKKVLELGLPTSCDEDWKFTPFNFLYELPWHDRVPLVQRRIPKDLSYLGSEDVYRMVFINGCWQKELSDSVCGVDISVLKGDDISTESLAVEQLDNEIVVELTEALKTQMVKFTVAPKVILDKPLCIIHYIDSFDGAVCAMRHHYQLGRLSQVKIIEHHMNLSEVFHKGVVFSNTSIEAQDGAQGEYIKIVEQGSEQLHLAHNHIVTNRDANVTSSTYLLSGKWIRHKTSSELGGENGVVEMNSLSLPARGQCFDSRTYLNHSVSHCRSHQLHKVVAVDDGKGVFDGLIYVSPGALKTDGQMDNHNLLIGDKAQINSQPKLEIYADDVKCSHGATTGQLDQEQIFYLQARGIKKEFAERMIIKAFAKEVCDLVSFEPIRRYLLDHVEKKLEQSL